MVAAPPARCTAVSRSVRALGGGDAVGESATVVPAHVVGGFRIERRLVRAHPAVGEQLLKAGPQKVPVVEVGQVAFAAVDDDSAHPAWFEKRLVDGQVGEIGEQFGALVFVDGVAGRIVQGVDLPGRIVRVVGERVWGQHVGWHGLHGTGRAEQGNGDTMI